MICFLERKTQMFE